MDEKKLVSTKKCPFCQQWSEWEQQPDDRCSHCGKLLDPQASNRARQQAATAHEQAASKVRLIEIKPNDSFLMRLLKWIGRGGQLLFIALLSFFIWVVTIAAG
jgi:predicted amidophosphoribosyltransferase